MRFNQQILKVEQSKIREFNNLAHELKANVYMTLGEPDFYTPNIIKEACIEAINNNHTKYAHTYGSIDLRKKIIEFEKAKNNVNYDDNEILITCGSTEALTASLFTILNESDEVIVPTPCYALYRPIIEYMKAKMITIDTSNNNFQITKDMLVKAITNKTKAIILTSPNNPTGSIYDYDTLKAIHDLIIDKEIFVICDNCYEQLVYTEYKGFSQFSDLKKQIIICQSFSKPYAMTGWRIGYLMGDKEFIDQAAKIHQYMIVAANTFVSDAAMKALEFNPKEFVDDYRVRRDYIYDRLVKMGLEVVKPEGAFYIFPSIKKFSIDSWEFCKRLVIEKKLAVIPGICFEAEGYIRMSYCVDMDKITLACDLLEEFIKEL